MEMWNKCYVSGIFTENISRVAFCHILLVCLSSLESQASKIIWNLPTNSKQEVFTSIHDSLLLWTYWLICHFSYKHLAVATFPEFPVMA